MLLTNELHLYYTVGIFALYVGRSITMAKEKLVISSKKYRGDSTVISIRLPDGLVKELDRIAEETGRTRSEVIQKCLAFAADNLEIKEY